jgi:transposase
MKVFVGDDWAEAHHDVHLMNDHGGKLAAKRLPEGLDGIARFHAIISEHADDPSEVVIGIETERGMWVQALLAAGYMVFAINPLSVSRYRDRHSLAGAKSDPGDAKVLADLVRTDRHNHRPVAGDSDDVDGVKVLARAHQNLIWDRTRHTNRLRNDLREYFPAALVAFGELSHRDTVAVLAKATHPDQARKLSITQIRSALGKGGRQRNLDTRAAEIQTALRAPQLEAAPAITAAFAATTKALIAVIGGLNDAIVELETELASSFNQHPDADIYLSLPGLGVTLGARVLAEFGDDPEPLRRCQVSPKLRRDVTPNHRIRHQTGSARTPGPQPKALRRNRSVGVLLDHHKPRLPGLLRPTTRSRRPTPPSTTSPRQPARRLSPRMPQNPTALQRTHSLGTPTTTRNPNRRWDCRALR